MGVQIFMTKQASFTGERRPAPSIAADIDPIVTDMFIQCRNVLSLAACKMDFMAGN